MSRKNVCKIMIQSCTVNGLNCLSIIHNVKIYETVCKPYITAQLTFNNNSGQLNEAKPVSGQSVVTCSIVDSTGNSYNFYGIYTKAPDDFDTHNVGEGFVTIHAITQDYWNDKRSLVQDSTKNEPGTSLAQRIHNQYIGTPLKILEQSVGNLSQDSGGGYNVSGESPFTAIRIIGQKLTYGASKAGATVYFRDSTRHVFGPAQALVNQMSAQATVTQMETIGRNKDNIWGGLGYNSILVSKVYKKEEAPDAIAETAQAGGQAGVNDYEQYGRFAFAGKLGQSLGLISSAVRNEAHRRKAIDESSKTVAEWNYKAAMAAAPNYLMKIAIESGFKCTVGNGIQATLMAPLTGPYNTVEGLFLVADIMHDCYFDNREIMGTTTMRIVDAPRG